MNRKGNSAEKTWYNLEWPDSRDRKAGRKSNRPHLPWPVLCLFECFESPEEKNYKFTFFRTLVYLFKKLELSNSQLAFSVSLLSTYLVDQLTMLNVNMNCNSCKFKKILSQYYFFPNFIDFMMKNLGSFAVNLFLLVKYLLELPILHNNLEFPGFIKYL